MPKLELSLGEHVRFVADVETIDETLLRALALWVGVQPGGPAANKLGDLTKKISDQTDTLKGKVDEVQAGLDT